MTEVIGLERKFCQAGKGLSVAEGHRIEGYASVFDRVDQGGDVVVAGAYTAALERMRVQGRQVKMLWQHDPTQPIGVWDDVEEDDRGLFVRGRLLVDVARAREAAALIGAGAIDGLSIGYRTKRAERGPDGRRMLQELDLWEVSLVTFPMLPEARVAGKADTSDGFFDHTLAEALNAARRDMAEP